MWKLILVCLYLASWCQPALARKIFTNSEIPSVSVFLGDYRKDQPSTVNDDGLFLSLDYHQPLLSVDQHLGAVFGVQLAPDLYSKTQKVDIREDRYEAYALARLSIPSLFRFNFDVGPKVVLVRSAIKVFSESETHYDGLWGILTRGVIDYSTDDSWEVSLAVQFDYIPHDLKYNYGYGFGIKRYL